MGLDKSKVSDVTRASLAWRLWETDTVWMSQDDDRTRVRKSYDGDPGKPLTDLERAEAQPGAQNPSCLCPAL